MLAPPACGNESINVLAPRDARADTVADDAAPDVSVDAPSPDDGTMEDRPGVDGPAADISIMDGPAMDAPTVDIQTTDAPTIGCGAPGDSCSFAGKCCSLSCPNPSPGAARVCAADGICATVDEKCGNNTDCCSNRCTGDICELPAGRCRPAGEFCGRDDECCGNVCTVPAAGGPTRCARLAGACRVFGEVCVMNAECCSGRCNPDGAGNQFCAHAPPCGIGGNMCRGQAGDRCELTDGATDCCSAACIPGGEGPPRCAPQSCRGECALCAENRDCCTGQCIADDSGYRRCVNPIL
jgi:hypothetical protein